VGNRENMPYAFRQRSKKLGQLEKK